jgi:hypothetical protein
MPFNAGTATDYIDLLDQLIEVVTSRHLASVAINAAGTGYVAGEILGIDGTGATATHVALIEVVTVGGSGEITSARVYNAGAYTVDPTTTTGNGATGGSGSSATFDLTLDDTGWAQRRRTKVAVSAVVGAAGTGYSVSDTLNLIGGVLGQGGSAATFNVDTVGGSGEITGVSLVSVGQYEVPPSNAALVSVAPAGGSGGTLTVTYADKTGDTVVVLEGDAGGSNADPVVAIKTYQGLDESGANTTYNWALFMATVYSDLVAVHLLSNVSAGFNTTANDGTLTTTLGGDGAFFPCKPSDAFAIDWWIRATGRNITLSAKVRTASTTHYAEFSIGLLNPTGVTSEFPYPAYVLGASDRPKVWYGDVNAIFGGISDVISRGNGPGFFWAPEGAWVQFRNSTLSTNTSLSPNYGGQNAATPRAWLWPLGFGNARTDDDITWGTAPATGFDNEDLSAASPTLIYPTPNSAGALFPLFALTVGQADASTGNFRVMGEIDGAFWFSLGGAAISSEDRHARDGSFYRIFQSGTRVQPYSFFCIRED